jgi:hypothetical protein
MTGGARHVVRRRRRRREQRLRRPVQRARDAQRVAADHERHGVRRRMDAGNAGIGQVARQRRSDGGGVAGDALRRELPGAHQRPIQRRARHGRHAAQPAPILIGRRARVRPAQIMRQSHQLGQQRIHRLPSWRTWMP